MKALPCILVAFVSVVGASAVAAKDDAPKSSPEQRLMFAKQSAEQYRFRVEEPGRTEVMLQPEPLLRWNNQVVREDDGMLFLWTEGAKGRPVATAQFFLVETQWKHEFQSMTTDRFIARVEGKDARSWAWEPSRAGLKFVRAERIGPPAESANARLRQMKTIAERFSASVDRKGTFENPDQLRLLTTPIYRYSATAQGVVDGALFAFVQGTNPEVLMLVEADATAPAAKAWRYGFARMSCFWLRVQQGTQSAWSAELEKVPTTERSSPYFFREAAEPDRSAELEISPPRNNRN